MKWFKRIAVGLGATLFAAGVFAVTKIAAFDASLGKVYDVPIPTLERSTDPAVIARGKHLVESIAGCQGAGCHGADLGGGKLIKMGPIGTFGAPNITGAGFGAVYTDGELARLIRHGLKKDGRSVRMMTANDFNYLPDSDVVAIVSYLRTVPPVDRPNPPIELGTVAKILDRLNKLPIDIARRIDHDHIEIAPPPEPTAAYGQFPARTCTSCHGEHLSGGRVPGTPKRFATPLNLTPDDTGLKGWTYADFSRLLTQGIRKNGKQIDAFMPIDCFGKFDDIEMHAVFAFLQSLPPRPFGGR